MIWFKTYGMFFERNAKCTRSEYGQNRMLYIRTFPACTGGSVEPVLQCTKLANNHY